MTAARTAHVVLEQFSVQLFSAGNEHWQALLREYALRGMGGTAQSYSSDEVLRANNALAAMELLVPSTTKLGSQHPTLSGEVIAPGDFAMLQAVLDDALRLARTGELLVLPTLPEIMAFRNWFCDQVTGQAAGAAPEPWSFVAAPVVARDVPPAEWDPSLEPPPTVAWVIGDEHNRIMSVSPAALHLLGWDEAALVGQRLLAVIPPRLREAHVAGFTRAAVGGGGNLLGQPLSLPALTRDGREIPITLTLSRHPARHGRSVYLARLEPPPSTSRPA